MDAGAYGLGTPQHRSVTAVPTNAINVHQKTRLVRERLTIGLEIVDLCSHMPSLTTGQLAAVESVLGLLLRRQEQLETGLRERTDFTDDGLARLWAVEDRRWHQPGALRFMGRPTCRLCVAPSLPLEAPCPQRRAAVAA